MAGLADGQYSDRSTKDTLSQARLAHAQSLAKEADQAASRGRLVEACNQYDKAAQLMADNPRYAQKLLAQADEQRNEMAKKLYQLAEQKKRERLLGATWVLLTMAKELAKSGLAAEKIKKEPLPELQELLHPNRYNVQISITIGGTYTPKFTNMWIDDLSREFEKYKIQTVFFYRTRNGSLGASHLEAGARATHSH